MERIPASVHITDITISTLKFPPSRWQTFPESSTELLPELQLLDCKVVGQIAEDTLKFEFTKVEGISKGKQSRKIVESATLITGSNGVLYNLTYEPYKGVVSTLGQWCGWEIDATIPEFESLLPDEGGEIQIEPDGGIVFQTNWNEKGVSRGLAFIYCGLGGLQHSSKVLGDELLEDGWAVVQVFTVLNTPDYNTNIELIPTEDHTFAEVLVDMFDHKYTQIITSTQAIREMMEGKIPSLARSPIVLIGISAGALNAPAVFNAFNGDVDAIILVAGGANMLSIVQNGAFTKWRFSHDDGEKFSKDELLNIELEYLLLPSRDPYHLAPEFPHDNTLIIHAKWDAVVPAKNGDLLWERAGKPERWVYPSGHLGLFMSFHWHCDDIVRWLDSKIKCPVVD